MRDPLLWVLAVLVVFDVSATTALVGGHVVPRVRGLLHRHRMRRWVRTLPRPVPPLSHGRDGSGSLTAAGATRHLYPTAATPVASAAPHGRFRIQVGSL